MANVWIICKRELSGYFGTPIAYVFLAIFVFLSGIFAFYIGSFFEGGQADLRAFFQFHPWLYLFLIPALAMRLWAEERRAGTIELLFTLPVTMVEAVLGKFLAAWAFTAVALVLTFPLWITVNYLGDPDNGVVLASYLGSLLMAGAFLAIGSCISALTRNQVIAFVVMRRGVPGLRAQRISAGARLRRRARSGHRGGRGPLLQLPHPLPGHQQGRAPGERRRLLRLPHRVLAVRQRGGDRMAKGGMRTTRIPSARGTQETSRMTSRMMTTTGVVLAVVVLFAVNILASRLLGPARIDLTEHRLFTLSEGTRGILSSLDEPVTLRFYLSRRELERVPGIGGYADRVRALLEEYRRIAGGKLTVHVIDPEPFSEAEDRAVGYGLRGVPLGLDEGIFYFGLAGTNSVDDEEVIPFFAAEREQFLEYDVTKLVHNLSNPKRKIIGLLSSLPVEGQGPPMQAAMGGMGAEPWMVIDQIRQLFELRSLRPQLRGDPRGRRRPDAGSSADPAARGALRHRPVRARRRAGRRVRRPVLGDPAGRDGRRLHAAGRLEALRDRRAARRVGRDPGRGRGGGSGARAQGAHGAGGTHPDLRLPGLDEHHPADLRPGRHRHRQSRQPRVRHPGGSGAGARSDHHVHAARDHHPPRRAVHDRRRSPR